MRNGEKVAGQVDAFGQHFVVAIDRLDGHQFGIHIADPDQPIPFDAVPKIFLHVEMHRFFADLPDAVEQFVVATERAQFGNVAENRDRAYLL